jgi:hypothetical protein
MAFTGFLVIGVKLQEGLDGKGPAFWKAFGIPITADLLIFLGFYTAALLNRRRPDWHKRFMIVAAATVISAATWRLWVGAFGFHDWAMPAALASTKIFIVAGILHDLVSRRTIHPAWWIGFVVSGVVEVMSFMIVGTPLEEPIVRAISSFADLFGWMY